MRYQYYFCERASEKIISYLDEKNILYKPKNPEWGELIVFSVWSNNKSCEMILKELESMKVDSPLRFVTYTEKEISNSKYLVMRPKKQVVDIINYGEAYRYSCEWISSMGLEKVNHAEQVGTFAIRKEPSSKTSTAFWVEDTGFAEVFTDKRVYELVREYSLQGIKFENVMNKKRVYSENIFQMKSPHIINMDLIEMGHGERKEVCHICGKEQFFIDNIYQLHLDFSKLEVQSDLYMTERMWGQGIAYPIYIISQRFYQLLKQNKLVGGISLSPVIDCSR